MRQSSALLVLMVLLAPGVRAQLLPADSLMTVRGIVELRTDQTDSAGTWVVFLPVPVRVKNLLTNSITVADGERLAGRFVDRYVELQGWVMVAPNDAGHAVAVANEPRIREVRPEGLVQADIDLTVSEHASVQLAVVPRAAVWVDRSGAPTGVTPTVLFSVVNHSQTEQRFFFPTNDVVCVRVRPADGGSAHEVTWKVAGRDQLVTLRMETVFRQILSIPSTIAAYPGRYTVRASLCGADQFHAEAAFEILPP